MSIAPIDAPPLSLEYGLEQLHDFMLDDHLDCEFDHAANPQSPTCSETVTYRALQCDSAALLCQNSGDYLLSLIAEDVRDVVCAGCSKNIAECWRVYPI